jgi:hypothetical protein
LTSLPALNCLKLNDLYANTNLLDSIEGLAKGKYPNFSFLDLENNKLKSLPAFNCEKLIIRVT